MNRVDVPFVQSAEAKVGTADETQRIEQVNDPGLALQSHESREIPCFPEQFYPPGRKFLFIVAPIPFPDELAQLCQSRTA
ncbi:hypothetical protein WBP07_21045 (plasmid) [Novosphingobium sp. BL-8A]